MFNSLTKLLIVIALIVCQAFAEFVTLPGFFSTSVCSTGKCVMAILDWDQGSYIDIECNDGEKPRIISKVKQTLTVEYYCTDD